MSQSTYRHAPAPHSSLRNELLGNIHGNARKLGLETKGDRGSYEAVLHVLIGRDSCYYASLEELRLVDRVLAARVSDRAIVDIKLSPLVETYSHISVTDEEALAVLN